MDNFFMECKLLIHSEFANKNNAPHILATSVKSYKQYSDTVEFDFSDVFHREDKYKDIIGFYHTNPPDMFVLNEQDILVMQQWVKCLGKSLVCVIESGGILYSWLFYNDESGEILHKEVKTLTANDVNYDIWLEPREQFWNSADFLLSDDMSDSELLDDISYKVDLLENNDQQLFLAVKAINDSLSALSKNIEILSDVQNTLIDELSK